MMIMVKIISRDNAPIIAAPRILSIGLLSAPFSLSVTKILIFNPGILVVGHMNYIHCLACIPRFCCIMDTVTHW